MAKAGMRRPDPKEPHGTESNHKTHIPKKDMPPVPEIQSILRIGKSKAHEICDGTLFRVIPIGSTKRICKDSFDEWYDNHF
jgi:hypothetical protein